MVLAAVVLVSVREPVRQTDDTTGVDSTQAEMASDVDWRRKVTLVCKTFFQPSLLMLCLAGSVRNAGQKARLSVCVSTSFMTWLFRLIGNRLSWDITTIYVNSVVHPSGVAKSSTSFGWGKGGKVAAAG